MSINPRAAWRPEHLQGSINAFVFSGCQGPVDAKWELLQLKAAPHVATLCLPDDTARDQISQASSLCICILQAMGTA